MRLARGQLQRLPVSTMTLKLAIEDAIHKAAPDVDEIVAEASSPSRRRRCSRSAPQTDGP